jgi:hypothetical protein
LTKILISKKFEKEIVFESSVLAWIRIRIEQKCWIRIRFKSIRIHNPPFSHLQPMVSMKFLGDEETVRKAIESVAAQGKAK